jgi:hypothetical protein
MMNGFLALWLTLSSSAFAGQPQNIVVETSRPPPTILIETSRPTPSMMDFDFSVWMLVCREWLLGMLDQH